MSEYRYYEFRALDEPLSEAQVSELRGISSRAEITSTSFINEYHWGDLKARPKQLVEEYFDAYLHIANYGVREVMFRMPLGTLDVEVAGQYQCDECLHIWETDSHHIISFSPYLEDLGREEWWEDQHLLPSMLPLRERLAAGDFRSLYLGWLFSAVYTWMDPEEQEPPVPTGIDELDGPSSALAQFLLLNDEQLQVAAEASRSPSEQPSDTELKRWLAEQPEESKLDWLMAFVRDGAGMPSTSILRQFAKDHGLVLAGDVTSVSKRRTAGEVFERVERLQEKREARERERRRKEEERKRREKQRRREAYLDEIVGRQEELWSEVIELVADSYAAGDYDAAVKTLVDLRDLAHRRGETADFRRRLADFEERYDRRRALMRRIADKVWNGS